MYPRGRPYYSPEKVGRSPSRNARTPVCASTETSTSRNASPSTRQSVGRLRRPDRALDPTQGDRRLAGQPHRVVARLRLQLLRLDQEVHDPVRRRLLGRELDPLHDQLRRAGRADEPGQPLCPPGAGQQSEPHLRQADQRALGPRGEAEVTRERELEPAAERMPVDRGDRRLRNLGEAAEDLLRQQRAVDPLLGDPLELVDVGAGHEHALERAPHEHRAGLAVGGQLRSRLGELGDHLSVDRVQRRPVEREDGDLRVGEPLQRDRRGQTSPRRR